MRKIQKAEKRMLEVGEYTMEVYRFQDGSYWFSVAQVKAKINKFDSSLESFMLPFVDQLSIAEVDGDEIEVIPMPLACMYWTLHCVQNKEESATKLIQTILVQK